MSSRPLAEIAALAGVQLGYHNPAGQWSAATDKGLAAVLKARGSTPLGPPSEWPATLPLTGWRANPSRRDWGVFIPHHALRSANSLGLGSYSDLLDLGLWAAQNGASTLATLPLLPTFLDSTGPYEPSPYAPVSRRHWGEHLIDPTQCQDWAGCTKAQAILEAADRDGTLTSLRAGELIDPRASWALLWRVLMALADHAHRHGGVQQSVDPDIALYARFRAVVSAQGAWPTWATDQRWQDPGLGLDQRSVDPAVERTWIYAQQQARLQLARLRDGLAAVGVALYLDLPIGSHPDGFDTFCAAANGPLYAQGVSTGAPPDPYFPSGQDWGFPPVHPALSAQHNHADLRRALRHHGAYAHRLRIDHILGFHRLFWVPAGMSPRDGVYVANPAQDWWQQLIAMSHAQRCEIVGENLGVLPAELTAALARHKVDGMYVGQFSIQPSAGSPLAAVTAGDLASLNTHDTPTFAGWWNSLDLDDHQALGWLSGPRRDHERGWRAHLVDSLRPLATTGPLASAVDNPAVQVMGALTMNLARSPAGTVLVNLEDLWGEARPHNVPGTWRERPNWLRRSALSLSEIQNHRPTEQLFAALREARPQ